MTTRPYRYFCIVLLAFLVSCGKQAVALPTEHPFPPVQLLHHSNASPTFALIPAIVTPSPLPTQLTIPIITPDHIQVEKWKEYQTELARVILPANPEIGNDPVIYKTALCEWDILGQSGQKVIHIFWCVGVTAKGNRDIRKPAIIYLEPDGSIQKVKIPEPKGPNSEMFNYDPFQKMYRKSSVTILILSHLISPDAPIPILVGLHAQG